MSNNDWSGKQQQRQYEQQQKILRNDLRRTSPEEMRKRHSPEGAHEADKALKYLVIGIIALGFIGLILVSIARLT